MVEVLEIAVGAIGAATRFWLVRVSIRDLVADRSRSEEILGSGAGSKFVPQPGQEVGLP